MVVLGLCFRFRILLFDWTYVHFWSLTGWRARSFFLHQRLFGCLIIRFDFPFALPFLGQKFLHTLDELKSNLLHNYNQDLHYPHYDYFQLKIFLHSQLLIYLHNYSKKQSSSNLHFEDSHFSFEHMDSMDSSTENELSNLNLLSLHYSFS